MPIIILIIAILVGSAIGFRRWKRAALRKSLLASPLTEAQRVIVADMVPLVTRLPDGLRKRLDGKINLFLHQVDMHGCDGLEVTDNMRLSIAAQACLIIVNSDAWYRNLRTILIYPGAFKSKQTIHDGFVVRQSEEVRLGESWSRGPVVLSWPHTHQGAVNDKDGQNLVLHEFAHQLDDLSGHTNGVPILVKGQSFAEWERVFLKAYEDHLRNVERNRKTVLDAYGAENHQEFFAVAIEAFFEKPARLKKEVPEVYAQLSQLLRLDPVTWSWAA